MNRLQNETSPYLLQHATNPVDWYPWGEEALARAKDNELPILISIGYATCHWCHVMEKESFENPEIAAYMNEYFVCIKIDREERPDLDTIYMDACEVMTGKGGWPMNLFLTPELKPFFGGTYFPIKNTIGDMQTWQEVLSYAAYNFYNNKLKVEQEANKIMTRIEQRNLVSTDTPPVPSDLSKQVVDGLVSMLDPIHGGFGKTMKFPNFMALDYLLTYSHYINDKNVLDQVAFAVNKILSGGIYDHIGGGISRYTTDSAWQVPHFEKMLYDNAQLISILADLYKITNDNNYKEFLDHSCNFILETMTSPDNGFYTALDADTEGVEGKYYTWSKSEIDDLLGEDASQFNQYYHVSQLGNWENTNILHCDLSTVLSDELKLSLQHSIAKLQVERTKRVAPLLDDKVILSWNALMCSAMIRAYESTDNKKYLKIAIDNLNYLKNTFFQSEIFTRTFRNGIAKGVANLRDIVYYISAAMDLYFHNSSADLLLEIDMLMNYIIHNFYDKESKKCYFTSTNQSNIILRKQDIVDQDMPATNSILIELLYKLNLLTEREVYKEIADQLLQSVTSELIDKPLLYASMAKQYLKVENGISEMVCIGPQATSFAHQINKHYIPNKIVYHTIKTNDNHPLSQWKEATNETLIYQCTGYSCQAPVGSVSALKL